MILDWLLLILAYFYVFGMIMVATQLKQSGKVSGQLARKIVHLGIGTLVILAPLLFTSKWFPVFIGITFIIITFITSPVSPIEKLRLSAFSDGHGFGTVYYSISLTLLLLLFFSNPWVIQAGFLPLVFGDAFANLVGRQYGSTKWSFAPHKSIEGSFGGFFASFIVLFVVLVFYQLIGSFGGSILLILLIVFLESLLATVIELLSPWGLDNLTIPIACTGLALAFNPLVGT